MDTDDQKEKIDSFGKQSRKAVQQIHLDQYERPFSIFFTWIIWIQLCLHYYFGNTETIPLIG